MRETMTRVGVDAHARSTHGAAIDVVSGELTRARFGAGTGEVVEWLCALPAPVHAVYEAGPTGFALARAGRAAGIAVDVVAPGKTARPRAERVKTDRRDAELLARLSLAGQLRPIAVPSEFVESARHLMRAREALRGDLLRARQRVSKLLLLHGRVYPDKTTWNRRHRTWLGRQRFEQARPNSPSSTCSPRSTAWWRERTRSTSGSHGWPKTSGCGRQWPGCAASAALTP